MKNTLNTLKCLKESNLYYYSLEALEKQGMGTIRRLPLTIRILLESLLRNCDGKRVREEDILALCKWPKKSSATSEIPFIVSRVLLQDFTGVPLIVDLAAMRDAALDLGYDPAIIEPKVPVDLIVDHSVQVDKAATDEAFSFNLKLEYERNLERYAFLKWGEHAFKTFRVVPPGIGICHQVNLEYLAQVVCEITSEGKSLLFFDTLVGTDSHTTMVNGLGVVGWGVGGIEAEAAMLGQVVSLPTPDVIGVHLTGQLRENVTGTDLALYITQLLRKEGVVNKFVEFFGSGVSHLTVADRATVANMSPEYGATMGFFPIDERTLEYLEMTGRNKEKLKVIHEYLLAQEMFGVPKKGEIDFTRVLELDLNTLQPSVSGPKRPQDRIPLNEVKEKFDHLLKAAVSEGGYGKNSQPRVFVHSVGSFSRSLPHESGGIEKGPLPAKQWSEDEMVINRPFTTPQSDPGYSKAHPTEGFLTHGSIVIAAITSCTNTSNPFVMVSAGLLAKKAVEQGLSVNPFVKTSLAPGSRVVTEYLQKADLQQYLDKLGFQLVGYGCTTCIGNSGPLDENIEKAVKEHDLIVASVLSGNRNFEARIHSVVKSNFLMSPPLVVAYAIAGSVLIDFETQPVGKNREGKPVFLRDIWPSSRDVEAVIAENLRPEMFTKRYAHVLEDAPTWKKINTKSGSSYAWDASSTYIQKPPYFEGFKIATAKKELLENMKCLALFGDSVTTDHISPAGAFGSKTPAGQYLLSQGVKEEEFNSYGSRRGNHHVMKRGTFANVRIKNKMAEGREGGFTKLVPDGTLLPIFDAAQIYAERKIPLIVFAGRDYGMGSSRDWAAKGTLLLGVKAVVAKSFERIHRSNLIGMGVLPLEFLESDSIETLNLTGQESFSLLGIETIRPQQTTKLRISDESGIREAELKLRIDTPIECEYYGNGGIMPYVLRHILSGVNREDNRL